MDKSQTIITENPEATQNVGEAVATSLISGGRWEERGFPYHILCLYGDLGAGKTVFVQGFAKKLGITPRLLSPTFIIVRRYDDVPACLHLYHVDLYRIATEKDIGSLGMDEFFSDNKSFVVVEWAERLGAMIPKKRIDIHFSGIDGSKRRIDITYVG